MSKLFFRKDISTMSKRPSRKSHDLDLESNAKKLRVADDSDDDEGDDDDDDVEIIEFNDSVTPKTNHIKRRGSERNLIVLDNPTSSAKSDLSRDMRQLTSIFPNYSLTTIQTAYDLFKNDSNPIDKACDHLLQNPQPSSDDEITYLTDSMPKSSADDSLMPKVQPELAMSERDKFSADLKEIFLVLKNCDPVTIFKKLKEFKTKPDRVQIVINNLIDTDYPKFEEYLKRLREKKKINNYLKKPLNIEEFLKIIPDPVDYFYKSSVKIEMCANYKGHAKIALMNEFNFMDEGCIQRVLAENNHHLAPAYKQLKNAVMHKEEELKKRAVDHITKYLIKSSSHGNKMFTLPVGFENIPKRNKFWKFFPSSFLYFLFFAFFQVKFYRDKKLYQLSNMLRVKKSFPDQVDELFLKEYQFVLNEDKITGKNYLIWNRPSRSMRIKLKCRLMCSIMQVLCDLMQFNAFEFVNRFAKILIQFELDNCVVSV